MALNDKAKEVLFELFGDSEKAMRWLEKHVGDPEQAIEDAGLMTRSVEQVEEGDPDPVDDTPEPPEAEPMDLEVVLEEGMIDAIVQRTAETLEERFDEIQTRLAGVAERLDAIEQRVQSGQEQAAEQHTEVERRLGELEVSDDEKQRQWLGDMPRKARVTATFRPRDNGADDAPPSAEDRVAEWLTTNDAMYPTS